MKKRLLLICLLMLLPDEFTVEDAVRCFNLANDSAARVKINRLIKDHLVEKSGDFVKNGTTKAIFKKTGRLAIVPLVKHCWI